MADKNYTNKIGVDTSEAQRGLKEISVSLKDLKASVQYATVASQDFNSKLVLLNKIVDENVEKEKLLENEYNKLANATDKDVIAITKAHEALERQRTATELARQDVKNFTKANEDARKAADEHAVKINTLSYVLSDLASTLAKKACKALVDFTKETINTGMQFESAFAGVRKVTSGTEEDFKNLENEIRKTALEKPISADQLASIYQMGSQLGIAKDGLKDFSNAIIDLAKTSDLTEEAGATMIAQYANVTGLKEEEYRKFASTLSYLGSTTATTESTIMDFASRISGSAKLIGMSHQEILALSTALGSVGIKAEMGGSAISKIMNSIDVAVDKNSKELQTWAQVAGVSSSEFANKWKTNVSGAFQDVLTGMTKFKDEGGSLNILLEKLDIKNIRQTETLKKLANASELLAEDMSKANEEWEKASFLGESAGQVYNTVESQLQLLKNSFAEMQISIYDGLKEPLAEAMKELSNLLRSNEFKAFGKVISTVMKTAINLITLTIKNMKAIIPVLTGIITKMLILKAIELKTTIVSGIKSLCSALISTTSAQLGLNAAMNANPIGLITTLIGLLVGGLVGLIMNYKDANEEVKAHTKALEEQRDKLIENREERERTIAGIDAEANKTQALVNELKTLVDENGRVKEGQQDRINTILPLIQNATGVEIECINGQITKYNELIGTLDQVIAKKRLEAKINAYQGDYEEALRQEEETKNDRIKYVSELIKKEDELEKYQNDIADKRKKTGLGYYNADAEIGRRKNEIAELKKQIELYDDSAKERKEVIDKYEGLITEQYNTFGNDSKTNNTEGASNAGAAAGKAYASSYNAAVDNENKKKSSSKKEETHTSYQELLNQEKTYQTQLQNYLTAIKQGNGEITVEMVEDTKKKLDEVQKKVKDMKQLLGDNTVSTKLVLDDETYGGLNKKREELAKQLKDMQSELTKGNKDITQDMLNNVGKQIDQIDAKIKNLKNEWDESGEDGEISDEFESENTNHKSTGVIFGKGVLGENAVEMAGAGKDAAAAYLEGYKAEKERQQEEIAKNAITQANQEALNYQIATIDPTNIEIYDATEKYLAESKQTSQAQGLEDNAYKVVNAETWTLNQAIAAAMQIDFTVVGKYICDGIALGIEQNKHVVIDAVRAMMEEANDVAESEEEIESPSKVFYRYGRFMDMGLANGIKDYAKLVSTQVQEMTSRANEAIGLANSHINAERYGNVQAFKGTGNTNINYNFTQNNTSNKSLDTLAIYQETKSMLKRTVRNQYV